MADTILYLDSISREIQLRRNTRIRRLSIKIGVGSGIIVCVPRGISDRQALQFVEAHKDWILKHLATEKYKIQPIPDEVQLISAKILFHKIEHNVSLLEKQEGNYLIRIPQNCNFEESEKIKRNLLNEILRLEAKTFLPVRVAELANLHGFKYGKLSFRNQKTRWGSCSYHNNISLNIQLMRLPLHLVDYVIIHELCHTVHKNHSAKFWQLVYDKIGDKLYSCKKEMRIQKIEL